MGVQDCADRLSHFCCIRRYERVSHSALQALVDLLQAGLQKLIAKVLVRCPTLLPQIVAHFDKQRPRRLLPEATIRTVVCWNKSGRGGHEFASRVAVIEQRPGLAARIVEVQNERTEERSVRKECVSPCRTRGR